MLLLQGCFNTPGLPECGPTLGCPPELPICADGLCFHHSLHYKVALCDGEGVTDSCCELDSGEGCRLAQQDFGVVDAILTPTLVVALDESGQVRWFDRELESLGTSIVEGGATGQLVADGGGACLRSPAGLVCASGPESGFSTVLEVDGATGRFARCPDGSMAMGRADILYLVAHKQQYLLPVPMGEMPGDLGPVIHLPSGVIAVPIYAGAAVRLLVPLGQSYDLTTLREFDVGEAELPGGVLGLALSREELFVAARGGRLHAIRVDAVPDSTDLNWSTEATGISWVAGPVVTATGEVLVVDEEGNLLIIDQASKAAVKVVASPGPLEGLHAVQGGISGLLVGSGVELIALAPAGLFPWLPSDGLFTAVGYPLPGCEEAMTLALGDDDGLALVACKSGLRQVVQPIPMDSGSPWPTVHGIGGSRCYWDK